MADHPFRVAWRTRDLDGWMDALSADVVLHSPVVSKPFRGRAAARELFGVLFERFGEMEIVSELAGEDSHAFFWRARVGGRMIEGADLMRCDEQGKIAEIAVMIRPLGDIAVFAAAVGPRLAALQSPARGALVAALTLPLRAILAAADVVASHLLGLRR
jgi:hypothetical protein